MTKIISEGIGEFYHHYPRVACVITAHAKEKDNAMAVAWHSVLSMNPQPRGLPISLLLTANSLGLISYPMRRLSCLPP